MVTWADYRNLLRGRPALLPRVEGAATIDVVHAPKLSQPQYPAGPCSPREGERRARVNRRKAPVPHRCGYVPVAPCVERRHDPPRRVGYTLDQGYQQQVYQCPVCHQVMTEAEMGS